MPDGFMMKHPIAQLAHGVETFGQLGAGAQAARHVREGGLKQARPQGLLIAAVKQAGPETKADLGYDTAGIVWFALLV